ncbi:MAG: transposase [Rhodopseudomonas sp.]|nr:transposase [Rhodopseudomonas sp.]
MEPLVLVTDLIATMLASAMDHARMRLRTAQAWPDPASGFAFRILTKAGYPKPEFMDARPAKQDANHFRRSPNLAAYGYVIDKCDDETRAAWLEGIEHLRGREIYPADRQSFIFNPVEILGVTAGLMALPEANAEGDWLSDTIIRGFKAGYFRTPLTTAAAQAALLALASSKSGQIQHQPLNLESLSGTDLLLTSGIELAFGGVVAEPLKLEERLIKAVISHPIAINDAAEAAAIAVIGQRVVDRLTFGSSETSPVERVIGLWRRFPLFVERLQSRQRSRAAFVVSDEYDVQDLLHAILRLHFDDVRPEEHTPSYAGNSSRVDFFLPPERIVVEAKMTRKNLGQKEVADELIIDAARYAQMDGVDTLICLVFDPERRCANPKTLENDVERSGARLKVRAVVCPHGL